jgi:hypothetical protein
MVRTELKEEKLTRIHKGDNNQGLNQKQKEGFGARLILIKEMKMDLGAFQEP